jgi:hypothetical protein
MGRGINRNEPEVEPMTPVAVNPLTQVPGIGGAETTGTWTASTEVVLPAAPIPHDVFSGLMSFYAVAGFLVIAGSFLAYRGMKKPGYAAMASGIVTSLACFMFVVFWGHVVGQPERNATADYTYSGSRLTTLVQVKDHVVERDVVEGRIVRIDNLLMMDGTTIALAHFEGGEKRQLNLDELQMARLVEALRVNDRQHSVDFRNNSI